MDPQENLQRTTNELVQWADNLQTRIQQVNVTQQANQSSQIEQPQQVNYLLVAWNIFKKTIQFIYVYIPKVVFFIVFAYYVVQLLLLIGDNILPIFIKSMKPTQGLDFMYQYLPYAFQPSKDFGHAFGKLMLFLSVIPVSLIYMLTDVVYRRDYNEYEVDEQYKDEPDVIEGWDEDGEEYYYISKPRDYNYWKILIAYIPAGLLCWFIVTWFNPAMFDQCIKWGTIIGLVVFGICYLSGYTIGGASGGCGSCDNEPISYTKPAKLQTKQTTYEHVKSNPVKTYKFERVKQLPDQVSAYRWEYIDGQRQGSGHGWSAPGRLVSFSTEQIVVQYGNQLQAYDAQTGFKSWTSAVS